MTPQSKFDHFGLVGNLDFNLAEMHQLDGMLDQNGFVHQLLVFDGKHAWPPYAEFNTALLWMQVNAMKEHLQQKNDTIMAAFKSDLEKRVAAAKVAGDAVQQQELLNGAVKVLDGSTDVADYKKQLADIGISDNYKKLWHYKSNCNEQRVHSNRNLPNNL